MMKQFMIARSGQQRHIHSRHHVRSSSTHRWSLHDSTWTTTGTMRTHRSLSRFNVRDASSIKRCDHDDKDRGNVLNKSSQATIGIFGDIHFQDVGLSRVIETGDWIYDQFRETGSSLTGIVCLGDVLNTRETVSVQSQSAAIQFFEKLSQLDVPIHILLGNHDLNLKHDSRISSLDVLGLHSLRDQFHLYRTISVTDIAHRPCVMIPYLEDRTLLKRWIMDNESRYTYSNMFAFGHLSLPGAIQRYQKDNRDRVFTKRYMGDRDDKDDDDDGANRDESQRSDRRRTNSVSVPSYLSRFNYLISGHFHHHHYLNDHVLYCGSPMQHHFGDSGDAGRGICLLKTDGDTNESHVQFVQNPTWDAFRLVRIHSEHDLEPIEQYRGKHVSVIYENPDIVPERVKDRLIRAGAIQVKKHSIVIRRIQKKGDLESSTVTKPDSTSLINSEKASPASFDELVPQYLSLFNLADNPQFRQLLLDQGQQLMREVSQQLHPSYHSDAKTLFNAKLQSVFIENFMGVQGSIELNVSEMDDGVWFIEGPNGSGKSTLLEAITWCLFNRFLRTDMKASFAVNDITRHNCRVLLKFDNGYSIERFRKYSESSNSALSTDAPPRKGNGIRVYKDNVYLSEYERGSIRDSQLKLEQLLGIDFNMFTKSVIVGESVFNFLSSDARERREMIENLLGFDQFDHFLAEVRLRKKQSQNEVVALKYSLENSNQALITLNESIEKSNQLEKAHMTTRASIIPTLDACQVEIRETDTELKRMEEQLASYQEYLSAKSKIESRNMILSALTSVNDRIRELQSQMQLLDEETTNYLQHVTQIEQLKDQIASDQQIVQSLKGVESRELRAQRIENLEKLIQLHSCPYCSQSIGECTMEKLRADLNTHRLEDERAEKQMRQYEELKARIQQSNTQLAMLTQRIEYYVNFEMRNIKRLGDELQQLTLKRDSITRELDDISAQIPIETKRVVENSDLAHKDSYDTLTQTIAQLRSKQLEQHKHFYQLGSSLELTEQRLRDIKDDLSRMHMQRAEMEQTVKSKHASIGEKENLIACYNFWEKAFERRTRKVEEASVMSSSGSALGEVFNTKSDTVDSVLPSAVVHTDKQIGRNQFITMRSYLLEQSIDDLNKILREYTALLGPNSLPVSFDHDFMIREDYGKRSAGQRKRNHLVIFFALFELVRQQSRFQPNFLMLDEVFDTIDHIGQQHVNDVIQMISTQHVDKVFIITHNMTKHKPTGEATGGEGCNFLIEVQMTDKGTAWNIS